MDRVMVLSTGLPSRVAGLNNHSFTARKADWSSSARPLDWSTFTVLGLPLLPTSTSSETVPSQPLRLAIIGYSGLGLRVDDARVAATNTGGAAGATGTLGKATGAGDAGGGGVTGSTGGGSTGGRGLSLGAGLGFGFGLGFGGGGGCGAATACGGGGGCTTGGGAGLTSESSTTRGVTAGTDGGSGCCNHNQTQTWASTDTATNRP